jgi:hypothetical protein
LRRRPKCESVELIRDIEVLITELRERAADLDLDGGNANQVLADEILEFLNDEHGREYRERLRQVALEAYRDAHREFESHQKELVALEGRLSAEHSVFSFVEGLVARAAAPS